MSSFAGSCPSRTRYCLSPRGRALDLPPPVRTNLAYCEEVKTGSGAMRHVLPHVVKGCNPVSMGGHGDEDMDTAKPWRASSKEEFKMHCKKALSRENGDVDFGKISQIATTDHWLLSQ